VSDWLLAGVRTRCLRRVGAGILVVAVATGFVVQQRRYFRNFFGGPYSFDAAELNAIDDPSTTTRYFARVKGAEAIDTGVRAFSVRKRGGVEISRTTTGSYYLLPVGDHFLLCKSSAGVRDGYEGELAPIPAELAAEVYSTPETAAMRDRAYPYYLDDASFRVPGVVAIVTLLAVIFLLKRLAHPAWKYVNDPSSHPLVTRAKTWPDPIGTVASAQQEAGAVRYYGGAGWRVTDRFLIQSSFFRFNILRLADLLWAYKKVTQHSVNFIPTRKTYETVLACYGGTAVIPADAAVAQLILAFAAERAPWAIVGYSDELAAAFKKDSSGFAATVEQRRRGGMRAGSAADGARGKPGGRRIRGMDVEETIELTFADARAGTRRSVQAGDGSILEVSIPAGVEFGSVLRLRGKGLPGPAGGGTGGNLYIHIILRVPPNASGL
jgi:hypothetical protein